MASPAVMKQPSLVKHICGKFAVWANQNGRTPSPQLFQEWDEKYNHSQMEEVFGGDQAIHRAGLKALYSQYFYTYFRQSFERPDGTGSISVASKRKAGPGVGNFGDIMAPTCDKAQREYMAAKLDKLIDTLIQTSELLGLSRKELLKRIEDK